MGRKKTSSSSKQQAAPSSSSSPTSTPAGETKLEATAHVIEALPGFFGHAIAPGSTLTWENENDELALQLHTASLGAEMVVAGRSTLLVTAKDMTTALCTLQQQYAEQWNLTHMFTPLDGPVAFTNKGVNTIHVSGMVDVEDDEDEEDCCGGDHHHHGGEEEEEEFDIVDEDEDEDDEDDDEENNGLAIFGGLDDSSSDEDDEADEDRFEVLEERMHDMVKEEKEPAAKTKSPAKETKAAAEKTTPTKSTEAKKSPAKKSDDAVAAKASPAKKQAASKEEPKAVAGKKRAAAEDSANATKKPKNVRDYKGIKIEEHNVGKGQPVQRGKKVAILYRGTLESGKQFDANQNRKKPFTFRHGLGDVIKGMDIGIEGMRTGGKRTITIPPHLGYGRQGAPPAIPRNATLVFDIELL